MEEDTLLICRKTGEDRGRQGKTGEDSNPDKFDPICLLRYVKIYDHGNEIQNNAAL